MSKAEDVEQVDDMTLEYASWHRKRSSPGPADAGFIEVFKWAFRVAILLPFVAGAIWIAILLCGG